MTTKTPFTEPSCPPCPLSPSDSKVQAVIKFLIYSRSRSTPKSQFEDQVSALIRKERDTKIPAHCKHPIHHADVVKSSWIEQGIWNPTWKKYEPGLEWQHEGPSYFTAAEASTKSLWEREKVTDRLAAERDRSRPLNQFLYQIRQLQLRKAEKFYQEQQNPNATQPKDTASVDYEEVKNNWQERRIWQKDWTILPGPNWLHEYPLEDVLRDALGDDRVDNSAEAKHAIQEDKLRARATIVAGVVQAATLDMANSNLEWAAVNKLVAERPRKEKPKARAVLGEVQRRSRALDAQNAGEERKSKQVSQPKQPRKGGQVPQGPLRRSPRIREIQRRDALKDMF